VWQVLGRFWRRGVKFERDIAEVVEERRNRRVARVEKEGDMVRVIGFGEDILVVVVVCENG